MSINNILQTFSQQELVLSHNETERNKINSSLIQLEKVLKDKLHNNISSFLRFGSFTRNTILPRKYDPQSDIDLMVIFDTKNGTKTAGTYRKNILDVISNSYPNSISKKDFPAVKLQLNYIMFDIIPAYTEDTWFGTKSYFIPADNSDSWKLTDPNDVNKSISDKNKRVGNNIIRNIIRLCKHWNASAGYPKYSYLMEKEILNITFWGNENTYSGFLKVMNSIAGDRPGVRQALQYIKHYEGNYYNTANEYKQLEWLRKLLPGLP